VEPERSGDDAGGTRRVSKANQPITEAPIVARCGEFAGVIERGRRGIDTVSVRTDPKRLRRIVREFKEWCRTNGNRRIAWIMGMVKAKLRGLRNYFGVTGNSACLRNLNILFRSTLFRRLNRRSERRSYAWPTFSRIWTMLNVSFPFLLGEKHFYVYGKSIRVNY
jgi:hypothetical protein